MARDVHRLLNDLADAVRADPTLEATSLAGLGRCRLRPVHRSWSALMLLGAQDFYDRDDVPAVQIVPEDLWTIDVPSMDVAWDPEVHPAWRWLGQDWDLPVPAESVAVTHLPALRGAPVTELARWEDDQWEMFAGPGADIDWVEVRIVPIGTMLAADPTLETALRTPVGSGYWREGPDGAWQEWRSSGDAPAE